MAQQVIALDSSILIDFFRKRKKEKTTFFRLSETHDSFAVSVITQFEVLVGSPPETEPFWNEFFDDLVILPLTEDCIETALRLDRQLKQKNQRIDLPDLLIAATAITNQIQLATLNVRHFSRMEGLELIKAT